MAQKRVIATWCVAIFLDTITPAKNPRPISLSAVQEMHQKNHDQHQKIPAISNEHILNTSNSIATQPQISATQLHQEEHAKQKNIQEVEVEIENHDQNAKIAPHQEKNKTMEKIKEAAQIGGGIAALGASGAMLAAGGAAIVGGSIGLTKAIDVAQDKHDDLTLGAEPELPDETK